MSACFHTASVTCENCRHLRNPINTLPLVAGRGITLPPGEPLHALDIKQVLKQRDEARAEAARLRERLQFDPGGSDKIDELEDAVKYLRDDVEKAAWEITKLRNALAAISLDEYESTSSASEKVHGHARIARKALYGDES
jgi:hypothetical protein